MSGTMCTWTERDEVFAAYARDALSPEDRDAFEEHFFSCEACCDKLQTLQAVQAQLRSRPGEAPAAHVAQARPWRWALVPVAAGVVLLAAIALWPTGRAPVAPASTVSQAPRPQPPAGAPAAQIPAAERPVQPPPALVAPEIGPVAPAAKPPAPAPVVALAVLAHVEPPPYIPLSLRGPRNEAAARFDAAMRRYASRDYAGAIPDLSAAARLSPSSSHVSFFLAICQLLTDQLDAAIAGLENTIDLGETPYLEEAHFYLAKARLRQGDVRAAQSELKRTIELKGQLEADARRLLAQVEARLREP
jgi:TolA-binding protein